MTLEGRNAVVTGGGSGIGAACASALAAEGARVLVCARTRESVERVAAAIGGKATATPCDVTDPESVRAMARVAAERLGRVDILINNAGAGHSAPLVKETLDDWNRMLAVNATSAFLCTREFLPRMIEAGWGRVVNVASVAGLSGARYIASYAAAKHAVIGLTRCAAAEAAASGVTVNAVCPGYVDTPMTEASLARIMQRSGLSREQAGAAILEKMPQGRLVTAEEVACQVVSLCREGSRGINGQCVVIDGGGLLS
ncbi:MAG: SDR family NAD(P)-dependent oxidoreductase [Candidatus Eiseniibacteriota bacterium]